MLANSPWQFSSKMSACEWSKPCRKSSYLIGSWGILPKAKNNPLQAKTANITYVYLHHCSHCSSPFLVQIKNVTWDMDASISCWKECHFSWARKHEQDWLHINMLFSKLATLNSDKSRVWVATFSLGAVREASCTNQILAGWTWHWSKQFSYGFFASWRRGDFSFHAIENITSQKISCRVSGKMQFKRILAFGGAASDANNLLVTICSSPSVLAIHHIHSADSKHIEVPFPSSAIRGCWDSPPRNWSPKVWSCKNPALWVL